MNFKEKAQQLKNDVPAVFLAFKKKETPWYAKVMAILTISYALSPIDLIPDFIPVLGYLDDIIILPSMVAITFKLIPKDIIEACRIESEQFWKEDRPKKWYYAMPVVIIWLIIFVFIIKALI